MKKVRNIIKSARGNMSQKQFAQLLGKSQGVISKYERGVVSPPAETVDKCIDIIETNKSKLEISAEGLATRIKNELREPQFRSERRMITTILDGIQTEDKY